MTKRAALAAAVFTISAPAFARDESILRQPDQHPDYVAELDVHGVVAYSGAGPGWLGRQGYIGFGPGLIANIRILKNGFLPKVNNNVAIGIGAGLVFDTDGSVRLITPVVLQWNFWLTQHWSVFGEPGFAIEFPMSPASNELSGEPVFFSWSFSFGARYNFNDHIALVGRLGYPLTTIGVSFFL